MNIPTYGILTDNQLCYIHAGTKQWTTHTTDIRTFTHVGQLITLARSHYLTRLWVHLSIEAYEALPDTFLSDALEAGYNVFPTDFATTPYVLGWYVEPHYKEVGIGFTNHLSSRWCIECGHTTKEVYTALYYLERVLEVPMQFSPANVGQRILRETNTGTRSVYLTPPTNDMSLFKGTMPHTGVWERRLHSYERTRKYLHHIDRNASYLNSCAISVGYGDYEHLQGVQFDKKVPGLWHITVEGSSLYEGERFPCITPLLQSGTRRGWEYTPTVQLLTDVGYRVTVHEAMIWPTRRANILEPFKKICSTAYVGLREDTSTYKNRVAASIAMEALKGVYVSALSTLTHETPYKDSKYINRPDWYRMIVDDSNQRTFRTIMKHLSVAGNTPLMRLSDGLWYASDYEDIAEVFSDILMNGRVGHYKHVYTLPLSECLDILDSDLACSLKSGELKKKVRGYEHA